MENTCNQYPTVSPRVVSPCVLVLCVFAATLCNQELLIIHHHIHLYDQIGTQPGCIPFYYGVLVLSAVIYSHFPQYESC